MNHTLTTLVAALALCGTAIAQAPTAPARPATPAKAPAKPAPAVAADHDDREPNEDEELALAALEGLMAQPGDRALPIVRKVLAGPQSRLVKKRALFVLSQIHSPEAQQLLAQTARSGDAGMRAEAIRAIRG